MDYNKKFYKKYGLKITDAPILTEHNKHLTHTSHRFHRIVTENKNITPQLINEIESYITRYPKVAALKNYLYIAYVQTKQKERAMITLNQTIAQHPNYIFGHLNLADKCIEEKNYDKAAAILKAPYDIRHFETEAYIHYSAFWSYYATATHVEIARNNIEEAQRLHRLLFEYDPTDTSLEELGLRIVIARMKTNSLFQKMENKREVISTLKPIQGSYLSDSNGKPIFHHTEIHQIYSYSINDIPKEVIQQILALPRPTLIADLEHALLDSVLRYDYFQSIEWNEAENDFAFHALYLLTELKAYESLPVVLDFLRQSDDFSEFWCSDLLENYFHPTLYLLAHTQLTALKSYVLEENNFTWFRLLATHVATQVALKEPERREEVLQWFREVIEYHLAQPNNDNLIDTYFLDGLMDDMINFGAVELIEDIKTLYATGWISDVASGNLEEILKEIQIDDRAYHNKPLPVDIYELYSGDYQNREAKSNRYIDTSKISEVLSDPYEQFLTTLLSKSLSNKAKQDMYEYDDEEEEDDDDMTLLPHMTVKRAEPKTGRNDPCPCGSGQKYKKCHGK
jgi:tetratricopeptide (TPR) repeat protein